MELERTSSSRKAVETTYKKGIRMAKKAFKIFADRVTRDVSLRKYFMTIQHRFNGKKMEGIYCEFTYPNGWKIRTEKLRRRKPKFSDSAAFIRDEAPVCFLGFEFYLVSGSARVHGSSAARRERNCWRPVRGSRMDPRKTAHLPGRQFIKELNRRLQGTTTITESEVTVNPYRFYRWARNVHSNGSTAGAEKKSSFTWKRSHERWKRLGIARPTITESKRLA